jgi:hypothetical protein
LAAVAWALCPRGRPDGQRPARLPVMTADCH